ncbi:MAG: hypothetical protein IKV93_01515 [Alphaproteobacteria bacterium]|nr:hypothetical protein [Alphaproteobacteria bacterium]
MRRVFVLFVLGLVGTAHASSVVLNGEIIKAQRSCDGLSDYLADMKTRAGVGTAVSAVGTVTGGVALGAGIAKAELDEKIRNAEDMEKLNWIDVDEKFYAELDEYARNADVSDLVQKMKDADKERSKKLGNIRTGMLATTTATSIAGAVASGTNRVGSDLQRKVNLCIESVNELSRTYMQERMNKNADNKQLTQAQDIVVACGAWETVNLSAIDNRAKNATISSGVGAGLGLVGTITSASANRDDADEKKLNVASNVLAGGATVASGTATVFNATQINAIKRAVDVAENCEKALR